jgi:2-polyprenyl-6-hydroxyphenyl methylase/3-demethylubiquinone-9 3-methyltransferase
MQKSMTKTTINQKELKKFEAMADEWWNPHGKFKPLHQFNPIRLSYIANMLKTEMNLPQHKLNQLQILDVGCGGGLIAEKLDQLGAKVTAIDASEVNINIAKTHQKSSNSKVNYQVATVENFKSENKFDVVTCLEVVEHVDNLDYFLNHLLAKVKKDGFVFIATINRTLKSLLFAKFAAEYILNWLPKGTHDFNKFLKPSELNNLLQQKSKLIAQSGFKYNILTQSWELSKNLNQNYIMLYKKN